MKKLSGVLITFNEELKVRAALRSMETVCDEIVVLDSQSQDQTPQICRQFTDRFYQKKWGGYVRQKQSATDLATYDWVLSLDADEKLSSELVQEISLWKQETNSKIWGYRIPRLTYFGGRFIYHTTWYPDYQMRLFRKSKGVWKGRRVHESFAVSGLTGRMTHPILHFTYASASEYLDQLERFSNMVAADYYDRGRRAGFGRLILYPPLIFLKNYLLKRGFLDGIPGALVSCLSAASTFFNYLKLWEIQRGQVKQETEWEQVKSIKRSRR